MNAQNRKELIQDYKMSPRTAGVILIQNKVNGKVFIAAGIDAKALLNRHRAQLSFGGHMNRQLQQDWNDCGADSFELKVLDTLEPEKNELEVPGKDIDELFAMWLEKLEPFGDKGYHKPKS